MRAFVEGFGCSLNRSDTEQLRGFLLKNGFSLEERPEKAGLIVVNTCAVKEQTETKMLRRIRQLNNVAEKEGGVLVVSGCLPKINREAVSKISEKIVQLGPSLEELSSFLGLPAQGFSPQVEEKKSSSVVSIIALCRGCLGNCAYCAAKNARGKLQSYPVEGLAKKFRVALKGSREIWLTAQDCGCYGFDLGTNLVSLLQALLRVEGEYRVRVGMINPGHLKGFLQAYLKLFEDERLYRFFHIPVQSGSDSVLSRMNRRYTRKDFLDIVGKIRSRYPDASIATDAIVGFPGETEKEFSETLGLVRLAKPDVVNISRFGARPNTLAAAMPGQLHGRVKKERSRLLTRACGEISLERNKRFVGKELRILVDEIGAKGGLVGRSRDYKPVAVKKAVLGEFRTVSVESAFPNYVLGEKPSLSRSK